jgi:hypothetical protein
MRFDVTNKSTTLLASICKEELAAAGKPGPTTGEFMKYLTKILSQDPTRIGMPAEAFQLLYPRVYEHLGGYYSPKLAATVLLITAREAETHAFDQLPIAHRLLYPSFHYLIAHKMPTLFIAPKLLEAVQHSDFKDDINWVDMKLPYEHGIFMLPQNSLRHATDGDVAFIVWSRLQKEVLIPPPPFPRGFATVSTDTRFSILAFTPEKGIWYDSNLTACNRPTLKLNNLFYLEPGERCPSVSSSNPLDEDLNEADTQFVEKLGCICFGTFLALNAKPELLEKATLLRTVAAKHANEKPKQFWYPNIIGRTYRIQQHSKTPGTHASPRLHWRRGHFRNQPYGPKQQTQYKVLWLEPMLVGALATNEVTVSSSQFK